MTFDEAFQALLGNEGGYVDSPSDPGGATNHGITERVARANGFKGDMRELSVEFAKTIAHDVYWMQAHCDEVPDEVAFDVFDAAYNEGPREAIMMLQRALNVTPDGDFGIQTASAAADANPYRLKCFFNAARLTFYTSLPTWETFGRGWTNRVAGNLQR